VCSSEKIKPYKSAIFPEGDPESCKAIPGSEEANDAWCVANCGEDPPSCPADLCKCSKPGNKALADKIKKKDPCSESARKREGKSAIFPGGDPESCEAACGQPPTNAAWCKLNCALDEPNCPVDLCFCSTSGVSELASVSALPEGGDPDSCVAVSKAVTDGFVDDAWCKQNCALTPPKCPIDRCYCDDEMAIIIGEHYAKPSS
jgi:hypothetical protein